MAKTMQTEYRISEAGSCAKVLSAKRLGRGSIEDAPEWLEDIARESTRHEEWIVDDLREEGYIIATSPKCTRCENRRGIHIELSLPLLRMVGHLDGVALDLDFSEELATPLLGLGSIATSCKLHIVELKSLSRFRYKAWTEQGFLGFPAFAAQLTAYWHAANFCSPPALFVTKNRDTGEKTVLEVEEPPLDIDDILEKYLWVESNARAGKEVSCDQDSSSMLAKYCRHQDCPHRKER